MSNSISDKEFKTDEEILDWHKEADAIIRDVKDHLKEIAISKNLLSNQFEIYLNIQTLEQDKYCIRASGSGFQIAGHSYDVTDKIHDEDNNIFETPYALLNSISPGYVQSFATKLSQKIKNTLM